VAAYPLLKEHLTKAIVSSWGIADGITDTGMSSLKKFAANKLANWQASEHPLVHRCMRK
jgi:hypothetical protein